MGLDLIELVLTVEEEFDIDLPDAEMENVCTPKDLAEYIHQRYQEYDKDKCSSQVGFYKVRKIMIEHFGFERHQLRPDTKLQDLFQNNIRKKWKQIHHIFDSKLDYPSLAFTKNGSDLVLWLSILTTLLFFYFFTSHSIDDTISILAAFIFSYLAFNFTLTPFYAIIIPPNYQTLSSLIKFTGESGKVAKYPTFESILDRVIEISIEQLNLNLDDITPDSRYVEDLGAG